MKHRPRLTVRPDIAYTITRILIGSAAILLIFCVICPDLGALTSGLVCLLPFSLWAAYLFLRCRNKRIFVFDWGLVFCDLWGAMTKVSYKDISSVQFSARRYFVTAQFYVGSNYVGSCHSRDENYDLLIKDLSCHIPEKLNWPKTF